MKKRIKLGNLMMGLFMLLILIVAGTTSANAQKALPYHLKLQKENTFENRMKTNESFTLKSLREDNKALKDELKKSERAKKTSSKRQDIKNENAGLRARIEDLQID